MKTSAPNASSQGSHPDPRHSHGDSTSENAETAQSSQNSQASSHSSNKDDLRASLKAAQTEQRRRELWMYLAVSIIAIEFFIFVAALFFAFISNDNGQLQFPWLSWAAVAVGVPSILLISVHLAVGLFSSSDKHDEEWQRHLPERIQKVYTIIRRAPAVVLLLGLVALGVALFTLDGAFQALEHFLILFKPYILHILVALAVVILILGLGSFWLSYRTRKLYADYEYRRAVLEKTGLIIVGKNNFILSGDQTTLTPIAAESAKALPQGQSAPTSAEANDGAPHNATHNATHNTTLAPPAGSVSGSQPSDSDDITDASYTEVSAKKE